MPEAGHGLTPRTSSSKWRTRLLKWLVLSIGWSTYILYRSFVVGQIKYDKDTGKMVIRPRNMWTKRIALVVKLFVIFKDNCGLHYIMLAMLPFFSLVGDYAEELKTQIFEDLVMAVIIQLSIWNVCRLYYWLRSLSWNRHFVCSVNEVIHIISLVEGTFGPIPLEGALLVILYLVQLQMTLLQMIAYCRKEYFILVVNMLLIEMFYNTYVAYQLLLISWIGSLKSFLESCHGEWLPTRQQHLKLVQLIRLYSRISSVHQGIVVLWLPVAGMLYSHIVILVCHWAAIISCIAFSHQDVGDKWRFILWRHLGGSLSPLLRILFIGLCNDRLAQLEKFLSLQLLIIDLSHPADPGFHKGLDCEIRKMQTCFDLQLRAQPIRNQIMSLQVCGCCFVLEYFFCALLNALNIVQYEMSSGGVIIN